MANQKTKDNEALPPPTAAAYVRVSSTGQLGRDGDEDGYSIPAQVKACERKATELEAPIARAYVERAESARSDDRPVLQQMLRELPNLGVKYLIVHKVDRLARNHLDDAVLYQRLVGMGITLVSATENIDETPAGRLMHGMLATFAEYYSNNLATEIKKGLRQKHENGGTPFKPPLGYRSKRQLIGGQDIRGVELDPERAPLVKLAFELYATGQWSLHKLAAHLEEQGLRYPATGKLPERPVRFTALHKLLHSPYYTGIVAFDGRRYPGRHEPLVTPELFDRVQVLLAANKTVGDRCQVHEHYLRRTIVCAECGGRLLYGRHKSRSGRYYEYFGCINRDARRRTVRCRTGYYSVAVVERKVEELYASLHLARKIQEQIRQEVTQELTDRAALIQREADRHERTLKTIQAKQEKLVGLYYKDLVDEDVFEREQTKLKAERRSADRLRGIATAQLDHIQEALALALSRLDAPHRTYLEGTPMERRLMNLAIFERIEVGEDGDLTGTTLTPPYEALRAWEPALGQLGPTGRCSADVRLPSLPVHHGGCGAVARRSRRRGGRDLGRSPGR